MELSPSWEANRSSATQESPRILWIPKVHYRIHNSPSPVPMLRQIVPVYAASHLSKIHFNIILPSLSGTSEWSSTLRFPHQNAVCSSNRSHTRYLLCPSQSSWLGPLNNIWWGAESVKSKTKLRPAKCSVGAGWWAGHVASMGERRDAYKVLVGNLRERDHLKNPNVDGRIILKLIFEKWNGSECTVSISFRIGAGGGLLWMR